MLNEDKILADWDFSNESLPPFKVSWYLWDRYKPVLVIFVVLMITSLLTMKTELLFAASIFLGILLLGILADLFKIYRVIGVKNWRKTKMQELMPERLQITEKGYFWNERFELWNSENMDVKVFYISTNKDIFGHSKLCYAGEDGFGEVPIPLGEESKTSQIIEHLNKLYR